MRKNVMIPTFLLLDLIKYHIFHIQDDEEINTRIKSELSDKMQRMLEREYYSKRFKDQTPLD